MRCLFLSACALGLSAAAAYEPTEVLTRAIQRAIDRSRAIPNYTCVETVTRVYFSPAATSLPRDCAILLEQRRHPTPDIILHPYSTDRLRLDVTMSSRGEIFSWPGASRFDDHDIDHVVRNGPMGTGSFGGFLATIFTSDAKRFRFERSLSVNGRVTMEYSFQVPQPDSHYKVKLNEGWTYVPYSGTFQVDPESGDVLSMGITTGASPLATGMCQSTTTLDFARVRIGDEQFMLPGHARQRFVYPTVEETENTTGFTNCREFRGESTVTFSPGEPAAPGSPKRVSSGTGNAIPPGLRFTLDLTASIPTDTAAAGDPFTAKLSDALRDDRNKVIAAKGSLVTGRLLRVQMFAHPPESLVVLQPEYVDTRSGRLALSAVRDWTYLVAQRRRTGKGVEVLIPLPGEENSGVFRFPGEHVVIPAKFRSDWKTAPPISREP
uniref:Uncharacterized protein n=1 Tax=Solibacter usitatus (strain Ellin6076) TaxID=234267 RepID=Q028Q5_SOLUE